MFFAAPGENIPQVTHRLRKLFVKIESMQIIPEQLRGRMFALLRTLMQSGNPLGGAIAGLLLPMLGMTAMIALSALVAGVPGLLGYQVGALRRAGSPGELLEQVALVAEGDLL